MRFSEHFGLKLTQSELDFVDVDPTRDTRLYLDPLALETRQDEWSVRCGDCIRTFFQELLDALRLEDDERCQDLMSHLHEPQETYLGESSGDPDGRGIAAEQGDQILEALRNSRAAVTGILSDLAESSLFIDGIDNDKISDLTTNVVRGPLLDYTAAQCELHGIGGLRPYGGPPVWNPVAAEWEGRQAMLPYIGANPIILVPKYAVRRATSLRGREFYDMHMIEFLRHERQAAIALARAIRGKVRRVTKKEIKAQRPYTGKAMLAEFAQRHPEILEEYKRTKTASGPLDPSKFDEDFDPAAIAAIVQRKLREIPPGKDAADDYHNLAIGFLTFLFHPSLVNPVKEAQINQGRKRIDIRYTNNYASPFFQKILAAPQTRAVSVVVECKNYADDIGNPELDQLAGRFSDVRGWFGMLLCRNVDDWDAVNARCHDLARDGHGFIIVLTDDDIHAMLQAVADKEYAVMERLLNRKFEALLR